MTSLKNTIIKLIKLSLSCQDVALLVKNIKIKIPGKLQKSRTEKKNENKYTDGNLIKKILQGDAFDVSVKHFLGI